MNLGLSGRVALIAGASRGIGRAVALSLAREGADVAVLARDEARLQAVAAEVKALDRRGLAVPADISDTAALDRAVEAVAEKLGPPTILVLAAAAMFPHRKLQFLSDEETRSLLATDLGGAVALCRRVLPHMVDARHGRILALGSLAARAGIPGGPTYSAAKAGLEGLMRCLALDYGRRGITANVAVLGFTETERLRERLGGSEEARERLVRATAIRRLTTPEEAAEVIAFLCSERAASITGAVVDVTGGAHLGNLW